ncbi:MAG: glycosyltransferase family 87 protein [Ferruginibacter sp.]
MQKNTASTSFWLKPTTVFVVYFIGINAISLQSVLAHHLNVWDIFRQSYYHLADQKDLYAFYPQEYNDSFLYSPSFSILFAPFAKLPYYLGYFAWNNLAMMLIPFLLYKLKGISTFQKAIICYVALVEMLTCLQGTQSNTIICALIILCFLSFENKNYWLAAFAIAIGFYIKIYPLIGAVFFLLYPGKLKFLLRLFIAFITIGILPLLLLNPSQLLQEYNNWWFILVRDQHDNYGVSLMGLIGANFGITDFSKLLVQAFGLACFGFPLLRFRLFTNYYYRLYFLCSMLIWVVLFNHAAEIYSYAIAIFGMALWISTQPNFKKFGIAITIFVIIVSVLPIDPSPKIISDFMQDYNLKALPFLAVYCVLIWQMLAKDELFFGYPMVNNPVNTPGLKPALQFKIT